MACSNVGFMIIARLVVAVVAIKYVPKRSPHVIVDATWRRLGDKEDEFEDGRQARTTTTTDEEKRR